MSTKTKNFKLTKPELTDVADITAMNKNWDDLDEYIGQHRIHSYTELSQFGLSDNEMSKTDFASNIDKIITKLNGNVADITLIVQNDINSNLHASLIKKMKDDTGINFMATLHNGWLSIRFSGDMYRSVVIDANLKTENTDRVWTCVYNKNGSPRISSFKRVGDIAYGGTGATNVADARKNLQIHADVDVSATDSTRINIWNRIITNKPGVYSAVIKIYDDGIDVPFDKTYTLFLHYSNYKIQNTLPAEAIGIPVNTIAGTFVLYAKYDNLSNEVICRVSGFNNGRIDARVNNESVDVLCFNRIA